jgi:hypothetical protein
MKGSIGLCKGVPVPSGLYLVRIDKLYARISVFACMQSTIHIIYL